MESRPQITLLLEDYDLLRQQIRELTTRIGELTKERDFAIANKGEHTIDLLAAFRAVLPLVQFSVGGMPIQTPSWPWRSLLHLAQLLAQLPTVTTQELELSHEWIQIAQEMRNWQDQRKELTKGEADKLVAEQENILKNYEAHMEELRKVREQHLQTAEEQTS